MDDPALHELSRRAGDLLRTRHWRVATAESCTGGWIAKCLTDVPGSSVYVDRGFVTYSNAAKADMLGVPAALIEAKGAVSESVVRIMASGALKHSAADCAVAVSGVAGPGGGTADKPVGLVWLAWAAHGVVTTKSALFEGDREAIRRQAVAVALQGLIEALE
ncbi:CinA family protein [bacterium]|nr:CinA family protein [bacterium]